MTSWPRTDLGSVRVGWTYAENTSLEDVEVWCRIALVCDFNILFNIMYFSPTFGPCYMLLQLLLKVLQWRIYFACLRLLWITQLAAGQRHEKVLWESKPQESEDIGLQIRLEHSFEGSLMDQLYPVFSNCVWIIASRRNLAHSLKETHRGLSRRSLGRCRLPWAWFVLGSHRPQSKRCWISLLNSYQLSGPIYSICFIFLRTLSLFSFHFSQFGNCELLQVREALVSLFGFLKSWWNVPRSSLLDNLN